MIYEHLTVDMEPTIEVNGVTQYHCPVHHCYYNGWGVVYVSEGDLQPGERICCKGSSRGVCDAEGNILRFVGVLYGIDRIGCTAELKDVSSRPTADGKGLEVTITEEYGFGILSPEAVEQLP